MSNTGWDYVRYEVCGQVEEYIRLVDEYIQDLPDDAFKNPAWLQKRRYSSILYHIGNNLIARGYYQAALGNLYGLRARSDGSLTPDFRGDDRNDFVTDPQAQQDLCRMIDDLMAYLETQM